MPIAAALFRSLHRARMAPLAGLPGPEPRFPLGNAGDFVGRLPWEVCADYVRAYGGVCVTWLGGSPVVVLNDPAAIGEVLVAGWAGFEKQTPRAELAPIVGPTELFISNPPDWTARRERHPFMQPWVREWLAGRVRPIRDLVGRRVDELVAGAQSGAWSQAGGVELVPTLMRLVFDAFAVAVVGRELGDEAWADFLALGRVGNRRLTAPLLLPVMNPFFYRRRARWFGRFAAAIAAARARPDPAAGDLVQETLRRGPAIPEAELPGLFANVFYGGVFSVTSVLATTLHQLRRNPEAGSRAAAEAATLARGTPDWGLAEVEGCRWLDACLREAMRVLPPVPFYARQVLAPAGVGLAGRTLAAGTRLFICNWTIHRSAARYPDPEQFLPARWENGGVARDPLGSDWFLPFGRGPRACVGAPFTMAVLPIVLATLLARARLTVGGPDPYAQDFFFGVMLPKGLTATFERNA